MFRFVVVALVIAPLYFTVGTTPAAACGCCECGYGYYGYTSAPYYSGWPPGRWSGYTSAPYYSYYGSSAPYYYNPRAYYGGYSYGPRVWGWRGDGYRSGWRGYGYRTEWRGYGNRLGRVRQWHGLCGMAIARVGGAALVGADGIAPGVLQQFEQPAAMSRIQTFDQAGRGLQSASIAP
jgi:hypothetical protein